MGIAANRYVYNLSSQDDADATWNSSTIAYVTLNAAIAASAAGETIAIASDHSEPALGALINAMGIGTSADPLIIISLNRADDTYQNMVDGGGRIVMSGTSNDLSLGEWVIWVGVDIFVSDNIYVNATGTHHVIDSKVEVLGDLYSLTAATHLTTTVFEKVVYVQAGAGTLNIAHCTFHWRGGSYSFNGGSITNLISTSSEGLNVIIEDVDLSAIGAGDYLVEASGTKTDILFKRCKIGAIAGFINGTIGNEGFNVKIHSCSASDIVYQFHEAYMYGTISDDTANYLNATADGSTGYSAKMVTNASPLEFYKPLKFKLADIWCAANPTLTIETITSNVTLQNDEFWIEVEYPDGTTKAQGNVMSSKVGASGESDWFGNPSTAPANLTTSTAAWTEVLATEVKQKIVLTIAGGGAGVHTVWACLAKPSTTVYVDPYVTVS